MTPPLGWLVQALAGDLLRFDPGTFLQPAGEPGIVGPGSVSWKVFGNPVALAVGGIAAVLLELGEPRVRAGVWNHSSFRHDPRERIRRTGLGAMITVFAARSRFKAYAARVNGIHAQVHGTTADGRPYRADDPDLLRWVQATAAFAFREAYETLVRPLGPGDADLFYAEAALGARYYGVADAPASNDEMTRYLATVRPGLGPSPVINEFLAIMRRGAVLPVLLRPLQPLLVRAAIERLPPEFRDQLGLGSERITNAAERRLLVLAAHAAERVRLPDDPRALAEQRLRTA